MTPRALHHGFDFHKIDDLLKKDLKENLLYEIGANKKSYLNNKLILYKQNFRLKTGIILITIGLIISFILLSLNIILNKFDDNIQNKKQTETSDLIINNMCKENNNNQDLDNDSNIPNVPDEDLARIDKESDSDDTVKK